MHSNYIPHINFHSIILIQQRLWFPAHLGTWDPFHKAFFQWQMTKISNKSADNQSEIRISLAYNKICHLSLMTSFVKRGRGLRNIKTVHLNLVCASICPSIYLFFLPPSSFNFFTYLAITILKAFSSLLWSSCTSQTPPPHNHHAIKYICNFTFYNTSFGQCR